MGTQSLPVSFCQQMSSNGLHHCIHNPLVLCWGVKRWLTLCAHRYHNVLTEGEADYLVQLVSYALQPPEQTLSSLQFPCSLRTIVETSRWTADPYHGGKWMSPHAGKAAHAEVRGGGQ